jgi:hypothetical protein
MQQITVEEVLEALKDYPHIPPHPPIGYRMQNGKALGTVIR